MTKKARNRTNQLIMEAFTMAVASRKVEPGLDFPRFNGYDSERLHSGLGYRLPIR